MSEELENDVISRALALSALRERELELRLMNRSWNPEAKKRERPAVRLNEILRTMKTIRGLPSHAAEANGPTKWELRVEQQKQVTLLAKDALIASYETDIAELKSLLASLRAHPQEPGDLISRSWAIAELRNLLGERVDGDSELDDVLLNLINGIVFRAIEKLSVPSGPLSDPQDENPWVLDSQGFNDVAGGPLSDEPREHIHEFGAWRKADRAASDGRWRAWSQCACGEYRYKDLASGDEPRELEWRECSDYKKLHLCTHEWDIYEAMHSDNLFVLQWHGGWMADCADVPAAKSLAASLQSILDGRPLWTEGETT